MLQNGVFSSAFSNRARQTKRETLLLLHFLFHVLKKYWSLWLGIHMVFIISLAA